jgi:hypothetical protein
MNDKRRERGEKIASGVASGVEMAAEAAGGLFSGFAGIFFHLLGGIIGIACTLGIIALIGFIIWSGVKDADLSAISENIQSGISSVTKGDVIEGWVSEVDSKVIVPTEEDIEEARRIHEEKAAKHEEETGRPYPFSFFPPKEREVTIVSFRDRRTKEFKGISPKPIPTQEYVRIIYGWTGSISDIEVVEQPDPEKEDNGVSGSQDAGQDS